MVFGKKKEEKRENFLPVPQFIVRPETVHEQSKSEAVESKKEEVKTEAKESKPTFAPLFIKLERYKQILEIMEYLKNTMGMIRNNFAVLAELEKLRADNLKMIQMTVEKVEKKLKELDSEFLRPEGFEEKTEEYRDITELQTTLSNLDKKIKDLQSELEKYAV